MTPGGAREAGRSRLKRSRFTAKRAILWLKSSCGSLAIQIRSSSCASINLRLTVESASSACLRSVTSMAQPIASEGTFDVESGDSVIENPAVLTVAPTEAVLYLKRLASAERSTLLWHGSRGSDLRGQSDFLWPLSTTARDQPSRVSQGSPMISRRTKKNTIELRSEFSDVLNHPQFAKSRQQLVHPPRSVLLAAQP